MAEGRGGAAERHRGRVGAEAQNDRPGDRLGVPSVTARLGQVWSFQNREVQFLVSMNLRSFNSVVGDKFSGILMWQKGGAALQNVTAGPSEPKRRTIGREIA